MGHLATGVVQDFKHFSLRFMGCQYPAGVQRKREFGIYLPVRGKGMQYGSGWMGHHTGGVTAPRKSLHHTAGTADAAKCGMPNLDLCSSHLWEIKLTKLFVLSRWASLDGWLENGVAESREAGRGTGFCATASMTASFSSAHVAITNNVERGEGSAMF
jgi:hypothetical protein